MALDFAAVEATITQTKVEVQELDTAAAALDVAKAALATIQTQVAEAQAAVASAALEANSQKADVVNGLNQAIAALQELLAQLA